MTREEAWNRIDAIIAKHEIDDVYVTITNFKDYDALRIARKTLEQESCEDCISREYILSKAHCCCDDLADDELCCVDVDDVKEAPSIQPKTGHWIVYEDCEGKTRRCVCDRCGHETGDYTWKNPNFCEECGAKMLPTDSEKATEFLAEARACAESEG